MNTIISALIVTIILWMITRLYIIYNMGKSSINENAKDAIMTIYYFLTGVIIGLSIGYIIITFNNI
jgi:hypothetical protein